MPQIPKLPYGQGTISVFNDELLIYKKSIKLPNGKTVRKSVYGKTSKQCMERMRDLEDELAKSFNTDNKTVLIDGIMRWLELTHKPTIKPQSYQRLVGTAKNQIEPSDIGHLRYTEISPEEIQLVINNLNDKGYSYSSIKKTYNLLTSFYKYASVKEGFNNPMALVNMPKVSNVLKEVKQIEWFEKDDIERFTNACGVRFPNGKLKYKYGYALAANMYMGLRAGELLSLQWKDLDFDKGTAYICKTLIEFRDPDTHKTHFVVQNSTKRDKNRYVPINTKAKDLLILHKENSAFVDPDDYIISTSNRKTNTIKNLSDMIKRIEEEGETTVRAHNTHILRHTCASLYFRAGVSIEIICQILGNTREVCENTYVHFVEEQLKTAASQTIKAIDFLT